MAFSPSMFGGGLGGILGGLFGNSGAPFDKAMQEYQKYMHMGQQTQQPYLDAGKGALGEYQQWLQGQKDPSKFTNDLMGKYQQSPYTAMLQQQAQAAGENSASASGMMGSTPFSQQQQQNAGNIAQQGMDSWLQNVLGVNTQYGQGQHNLVQGGQNSANKLTDMYNQMGKNMGEQSYNKEASKQNNFWNMIGGGIGMLGSFL